MPNFQVRDTTPELMDIEIVDFDTLQKCLVELAQANRLSLAYRPTLRFFDRLLKEQLIAPSRPALVLDAASGFGDMSRKIDRWAARRNIPLEFVGVDMNPWSARAAATATETGRPIRWVTADLFDYRPEGGIDIVMSSLFTHHLPDAMLVTFLKWMDATARIGWFINDLERHPLPYYALKIGFRLLRRHRFMQHDGPVSVASAFKRRDWIRYLGEAGIPLDEVRIEKWAPFRLCVSRLKPLSHAP